MKINNNHPHRSHRPHPLMVGSLVTDFVNTSVYSLVVDFVLSAGMNVYQSQSFIASIMSLLVSAAIIRYNKLTRISYSNFPKFLLLEAVISLILGITTMVFGSPYIYVIASILIVPFSRIQKYGVNALTAAAFEKAERLEFDNSIETYSHFAKCAGFAAGYILNCLISGPVAFGIMCAGEILNNVFYYTAYKRINSRTNKEEV